MHLLGNSWIYGLFVIGVCLLAASWLVAWQIKRVQRILARIKAEEGAAGEQGPGGKHESPKA